MNFSYKIRKAEIKDAFAIHQAHMKSIQNICSRDYTVEEIKAWGHRSFNEEQRLFAINNQIVYVATINENIEGYAHLKFYSDSESTRAHVMGLYLTPEANGKGIGTELLKTLVQEAKKHNVSEITLESTLTSRDFYLKNGFKEKGGIETIVINNQSIRCIPMIRPI